MPMPARGSRVARSSLSTGGGPGDNRRNERGRRGTRGVCPLHANRGAETGHKDEQNERHQAAQHPQCAEAPPTRRPGTQPERLVVPRVAREVSELDGGLWRPEEHGRR